METTLIVQGNLPALAPLFGCEALKALPVIPQALNLLLQEQETHTQQNEKDWTTIPMKNMEMPIANLPMN